MNNYRVTVGTRQFVIDAGRACTAVFQVLRDDFTENQVLDARATIGRISVEKLGKVEYNYFVNKHGGAGCDWEKIGPFTRQEAVVAHRDIEDGGRIIAYIVRERAGVKPLRTRRSA